MKGNKIPRKANPKQFLLPKKTMSRSKKVLEQKKQT